MPFTLHDLMARKARLELLSMGLLTELVTVNKGRDPLLRAERQEYLAEMRRA